MVVSSGRKECSLESKENALDPHRAALLALVDLAIAAFVPAYEAWTNAVAARDAAFSVEKLRRREHRRSMDAIFGGIREALPEDPQLREAIVPPLDVRSVKDDEEEEDAPVTPSVDTTPATA